MSIDNRVHLHVDQYSRIGIKDVISMLKGLRDEAVFNIAKASEVSDKLQGPNINNENNNNYSLSNVSNKVKRKTIIKNQ